MKHDSIKPEKRVSIKEAKNSLPAIVRAVAIPHILAEADPVPDTRDPFDRLLLAICHVEDMQLVTMDRSLVAHPLVWQPPAA